MFGRRDLEAEHNEYLSWRKRELLRNFQMLMSPATLGAGDLDLVGCRQLLEIPAFLDVRGDLSAFYCRNLRRIGCGVVVRGCLGLSKCCRLEALPEDLFVGLDLDLSGCHALHTWPRGVRFGRNLTLPDTIRELPDGFFVPGKLTIEEEILTGHFADLFRNFELPGSEGQPEEDAAESQNDRDGTSGLSRLPSGLKVGGSLTLKNCRGLRRLSTDIRVGGDMTVRFCSLLEALPENLVVSGNLEMVSLPKLICLPNGLNVLGALMVSDVYGLTTLPDDIRVQEALLIENCPWLERLPETLTEIGKPCAWEEPTFRLWRGLLDARDFGRGLFIHDCPSLRKLPPALRIHGSLEVTNCQSLTRLPDRLWVEKDLVLRGCTRLAALPEDIHVGGSLEIGGTRIRSIPRAVAARPVTMYGLKAAERVIERIEEITLREVVRERNPDRQRALLERIGLEKLIDSPFAEIEDHDVDAGGERQLRRVKMRSGEDLQALVVHCPSTGHRHVLRVPPDLRTCRQAMSWISGLGAFSPYRFDKEA